MIHFTPNSVELSVDVALALLAFCSKDKDRPNLGVGINQGEVCATDGHTAIRFKSAEPDKSLEGCAWPRAYVAQRIKIAKASKLSVLLLKEDSAKAHFPNVSAVEKDIAATVQLDSPVGWSGEFMGRLAVVCKACMREQRPAPVPPVVLESCSARSATRFSVGVRGLPGQYSHQAYVLIMPVRIE